MWHNVSLKTIFSSEMSKEKNTNKSQCTISSEVLSDDANDKQAIVWLEIIYIMNLTGSLKNDRIWFSLKNQNLVNTGKYQNKLWCNF